MKPIRRDPISNPLVRMAAVAAALILYVAAPLHAEPQGRNRTEDPERNAGPRPVPSLQTSRVAVPPLIDGRLNEAFWQDADVARDFTQMAPAPGRPSTQRTEVRVVHDDEAIYVGARMYDTAPDSIVAQLGRRDSGVHSDWFYVGIDSYFDRRTAFVFGINPRSVIQDMLLHSDTDQDQSWDAVWEGAAQRDAEGWTAEIRIPLSQLRFSEPRAGEQQRWGVNFLRNIARHGEESFWAPTLPDDGRVVSLFGELRGLDRLSPPRRLEVMPYVVASAKAAPGDRANPFHRSVDPFGGLGADIKAGVTSDLTLTATINPDFGQVEADPSVVNLSAFESFFSEKRPFFVEGVDIFQFGLGIGDGGLGSESLFYSRRIGRAPQGGVSGDYVSTPDATTILAAAKLSGKTPGGWSVGILDAVTSTEYGRFSLDGMEGQVPIEPFTNYGVARLMKDFREGRSAVGGIFTSTHRSLPESGELDWLRRSAYTGGLDFRHRFAGDAYQISGSFVTSRISGTPESLDAIQRSPVHYFHRPDADHLQYDPARTSMVGHAAKAELGKLQGDWRYMLFGMTISPEFEANDLGFQTNADMAVGGFWLGYQQNDQGKMFRRWNVGSNGWGGTTYGGERLALGGNVNGSFQFNNFWGGSAGINYEAETYSPSMLRGGPAFLRPARWNLWSNMNTDRRRTVSLGVSAGGSGQDATEGASAYVNPGVTVRPSTSSEVYVGPSWSWNRNALQYVTAAEVAGSSEWILGTVDQTTVAMTARINYTFSPTLSLQLYAQPFISAGEYSSFKRVEDPRARSFGDRIHTFGSDQVASETVAGQRRYSIDTDDDGTADIQFGDPSFNFKQLRSNMVLRWEYRPGSALFVVWSQGRTDFTRDGRFRFDDNVGELLGVPGTNVLMIKASYWFGL